MGSLATDFIWKGFADEYADKDVDLIPSTERMIEAKFKRLYTIFRLGHFASRIVELDNKFELPTNSILHIADNFAHPNNLDDLPDVNNNIFIQREHFLRYIYHDTELNLNGPCTYEDKYIYRIAGLPSKLMKFKSTYRGMFKYIATMDALPKKKEALLIINHNPLFRVKMFGRLQFFRRMELILTSILNNCCKLAEFGKNQFIFLPWDTDFFDKSKFLRSRTELNYASVKYPESFHYIVMMHLLNFLWDTATTSIFSKLPDEVLTQLYIVPYLDGKYIFYNLSVLKNLNVKNMAYRRVCNQLNLLSLTGLEETEKHPAYHDLVKETVTDAKEDPEHQSSITNLKDTPVSKIITTVQDEPDTPTNAEHKADIVERALTTINNGVRQVINKVVHPVPAVSHGIAETVKAKPAEHKVTPVSTDIVSPLNPVTAVKKNGEVTKRIAKVTKEANVTKIDTNLADTDNFAEDYIEDFDKDVDTYIDNYDMSPAAKNHFKRVAKAYKNLTIGGETIEELLENNSDSSLSDTTLDEKQLGYLPDKSALKSTLDTFEKDYIKKTFKKQLAGIVTSFAKEGAYLTGLKENKVVTDLHNYTEYKCQYTDIRGNKSTVNFKIPNVHSNGTVTIDGVTQIIKKQRCPLPIVKISDTVVSLASNFNKTRVVRNTNKAHSFFTYINNFVNDKTKSNAIVAYGNNKLNLPISYEYTVIGERYNNVQFTDIDSGTKYLFNFNYEERGQYFGKSADLLKELESEYGVYVGYNDKDYFFIDNNNTVFAVKRSGGEDTEYLYHSLIDIFKLSVFKEQRSKIKPLSEWITIRLLDLNMPVIFMLAYRYGLRNILDYMGVKYTITENRSKTIVGEGEVEAGTEAFDVKPVLARVQYLNELNKSGIDKNKIIIGASAALVAYGLLDTPNKDLDISIEDNYKKTLINKGVLVRNVEDGVTHWVVANTHIDAGVDGPDQQKFSYTELKKLGITVMNGYTFISLEGMIKFYEKCKELFPDDEKKQQKYNDRIALIEQALAGTEAFVQDKISGDIPSYDDSIEDYSKDTVVCYEGIWKDNFAKRDAHNYDGYKEINAELMDMIARINKKYDKDLSNNEAIKYIKEKLYSYGSRIVVTSADLDAWRKKYNLSDEDLINGYCTTQVFGDHYYASSYGKAIIPLIEQVIEDEAIALKTVNFARNELYGHEVYHLEHITDHILRFRQHGIHITKEFIDFMLLSRTAHEDGHSTAPKSVNDECLRTHTLDAHEKYANDWMIVKLREYVKDILNDKEEEEIVHVTSGIRKAADSVTDNIPHIFGLESLGRPATEDYKDDIVLATESYSRPVLARLGDVTIYATDNGNSTAFGTKTLAIRAIIITVKLGTKASCSRRIANFDGSHFQMANDGGVPRDVVDRLSQYLHCGKRKISKANLTMVSADKPLDPKVVNTPRLSPSEYSKLVTKLNIPGNKVMPPQPGNEALSEEVKYVPQPNDIHIRFADRVLHFNRYPLQKSLIVAGLANYDLTSYSMSEFEGKDVYFRILADEGTSTNYLKGIDDFYDLFIDNITYSVLKMMKEPTNVRDLLIRCAVLLSTTDHLPPSSGLNHRIRGYEQFAAILCNEMSRSFANFRSHKGLGNKFTINPDAVYLRIIQNATMLPAELGSPMEDMKLKAEVSYAGIGGRTAESFVVNDRRFDESDTGVIGEATVDNGKAGMAATLSYNPNIKGTLGIVQPTEDKNKIEPSQLWTTTALVFPCSTNDDTKRINFINIQSSHLVPVKQYDRLRVRTGYERIVAHRCSRIFAGVAEEDGKVTKIDDKAKLVEVTYKSGRKDVFTFGESYTEFQSFEVTNRVALDVKMGQSFKKGDIITHNTDYFHKDHDTGQVDFSIGSLANVALMESDATTEDSCEISERLSKKLTMYPTNERVVVLSAKSLVHYCAKVGDHVIPTDNLMIFEESPMTQSMFTADDDTLSMIADLNKATPHANHQGEIVKIDAYYGCEIKDMSPTLQPIVKAAVDEKIRRSKLASETDKADEYPTSSIIAKDSKYKGTMFTEDTVMLIFHIKEAIPHGTGDKLVLCNQLKCTCCGVFPKKLYTESGVEVDMLFSTRAMNKRIVLSAPLTGIASRILERVEDDICKEWFGEERPPQGSEKKE